MSTATSTQINSDELNFLTRVQTLPLVNDFNSLLESNSYSSAAIKQLNTIYSNHSALVTSLPLKRLNSFGNVALDQLESRIPQLKTIDTNSLLISVKSTPDHAKQIAKTYVEAANLVSSFLALSSRFGMYFTSIAFSCSFFTSTLFSC
jgi:hypothetical protein